MIHNLKKNKKHTWPTKISMPFLSSFDNLLKDAHIILQKSVDINLRKQNKLILSN